jgi:hypothetical protein
MKTWIDEAIQQNSQEKFAAILLKKNILDTLMNGYETHLTNINNKEQLQFIKEKKTEIEQLASTLREKQDEGKGPAKKENQLVAAAAADAAAIENQLVAADIANIN